MKYTSYKKGDLFKCIRPLTPTIHSLGGHGWLEGMIFEVEKDSGANNDIVWRKDGNGGIYKTWAEPFNENKEILETEYVIL